MFWDAAEAALRTYIETQWALGIHADVPLVFENEFSGNNDRFMIVNIEGIFSEKSIYGTAGSRSSQEHGIIFFHMFGSEGVGKQAILSPCVVMGTLLELRVLQQAIYLDGANPPSPVETSDALIPNIQPEGQYYRCSGSVPFILIGTR